MLFLEEYILPECTFTAPSGKIFDCWQLSGTEKTYESGDGYLAESDEDVTFIAVWAEAATIEFYPNGAEGSVISKKIAVGKEYTIPSGDDLFTAPTDKEFDYWFDDMESEQRYAGDVITITDTYYSFTARWKYLEGITYTVTFDSNGGSEVDPQVVNAGTNATKPTDPTKENYTFKGWYSNSTLTTSYSFLLPVTEDITLYAKWELTTYLVAFDSNGGSEVDSQDVVIGETATVPDEPTREDCTFEGWFTDSELTEEYDFDTPVTANIELFAKWSATYSVSGEGFTVFPHTSSETTEYSEVEDRVREINGVSLQIGIYSCYIDDEEHGRGMWIQPCNYGQGYDPQNPPESPVPQETDMGFMANSTPINGFIKSIAITVGPDRYNNGDSNAKLHVLFGTSAMLELTYTGGTTKTYGDSATEVFMAPEGCLYFNISNLSGEEGLTIESIVITYYVNN